MEGKSVIYDDTQRALMAYRDDRQRNCLKPTEHGPSCYCARKATHPRQDGASARDAKGRVARPSDQSPEQARSASADAPSGLHKDK